MASSTRSAAGWPKVMSSHHRNRSCNPCFICGLRQLRYDHYCTFKPAEQKFLQRHIGREIPSHACLCRAHRREAQRHKSDPEYVPIWKTTSKGSKPCMTCNYPGCSNTSSSARIIVPSGEIQLRFCEALGYQHCGAMGVMHVCETHYQHLYRQVHTLNPCAGCGAKPKVRQGAYTRHSPDPVYISQYLTQTTGFEVDLTPTDTICKACYDMHLVIQQNIQVPTSAPSAQLQSDLASWSTRSSDETIDELTRAVLTTVIFVGKSLQQDRALLLPQAVTVFTENYHQGNGSEELCLELRDGSVTFSARWLMNQLITHLEPYMSYKCTVKRLGTLLYPRNGNTLKSLSLALHKSHADSTMQGEQYVTPPLQTGHDSSAHVLREAGNILNNIIHDEIRRLKASDTDLTMFSLMDSIRDANQPLWEFVCSCTRSVRERTGRSDADQAYLKTLRRFFIICMLLFATNPTCDTTMHHLVADRVEVCGGSRELIRTLNRLGVCVSPDTHDRLVTSVAEQEKGKNLWDELCRDTFTVNTIDNCDFGQRHAAVYCGDQSRSYHGTTVQVVQPVPSLKVNASNSVTTPPATPTCSSLQNPHSPENEPTTGANLATQSGKSSLTNHPAPPISIRSTGNTQANDTSSVTSDTKSDGGVSPSPTVGCPIPIQPVALVGPITSVCKRRTYSYPANSPHKHGKAGSKRRRTIHSSPAKAFRLERQPAPASHRSTANIRNFLELDGETECRTKLSKEAFAYFLQKLTVSSPDSEQVLRPLREFLLPTPAQLADHNPSRIYYMEFIDENADSEETMAHVAETILEKVGSHTQKWVVLVGDGKTYEHLQRVKRLYESALDKVLIFPGDWHVLKNYQPVLIKAYYDAGLKDIAKMSGYRGETLKSLEKCSHFKRTHSFLIQVWEALYTEMIRAFVAANPSFSHLQMSIQSEFDQAVNQNTTSKDLLLTVQHLINEASALDEFNMFVAAQAESDDTWRFWSNFVLHDCFCYVGLFLAIRTSNWDLRLSSLKNMAALFSAYDRSCYQKLLPTHIADLQSYPTEVLKCFSAGGFTVKVKGGLGHAVALDEAHEMCINRDMKMAVARPTQPYLRKTTLFFSYRIKAQKNFTSQLFPPTPETPPKSRVLDNMMTTKQWESNINRMRLVVREHNLFFTPCTTTNRGLVNVFTGIQATPEQSHDLLNARKIGQQGYINYTTHHILQIPSVSNAPVRRKQLLTMTPPKNPQKRLSLKEKEERNTIKYLRRRLAWCNQTGQKYDESQEQYSVLPRALADVDGAPHKGNKSKWTEKIQARYNIPGTTPFVSAPEWIPDVAIIDAMFAINTNPLRQHKTLEQYAYLLFRQYIVPHFQHGTNEVHLVFDHPGRVPFNPKECEHKRRYSQGKTSTKEHAHVSFTPQSTIPRPWREYLECRQCKRSLVEALGWVYLHTGMHHLHEGQNLVLAGCFSGETQDDAWIITGGSSIPQPTEAYKSNALEADMRVWRHALQSQCQKILVYSPDTDVYNIGLPLVQPMCQYLVQINLPQNPPRYIDLHKLLVCFRCDPNLSSLPQDDLGSIMLQLYIVTGCDFVSYFSGIGKATFLKCFYQHADFIAGAHQTGSLSHTLAGNLSSGFLSLVRLTGTVYFKSNLASLVSKLGFETPNQLYNSMDPNLNEEEKHREWYLSIKRVIRIVHEDQRPPTLTALWRHWMRSCWIKQMWGNSNKPDHYVGLPCPESHGWHESNEGYSIDWEADDVVQQIQATLNFLDKGCTCKTGCKTKRCSCQKNGRPCGAGCECRGCTNILTSSSTTLTTVHEDEEGEDEDQEDEDQEEEEDEDQEEEEEEDDEEPCEKDTDEEDTAEETIQTEVITDMTTDLYVEQSFF